MRDVWGFEPVATSGSVDMALRDAQSALRRVAAERDFGAEMEIGTPCIEVSRRLSPDDSRKFF